MNAGMVLPAIVIVAAINAELLPAGAGWPSSQVSKRSVIDFNAGWLFAPADVPSGHSVMLNESAFDTVCLPHANKIIKHADFDTSAFAFVSWYRKHFTPSEGYKGRRFIIEFQGVSKAAEVFVNGMRVGEHKGAYTPFSFDITDKVKTGSDNVIAVRVDSRQRKDIPPEGVNVDYMIFGGIVRNVTMTLVNPLHIDWIYIQQDSLHRQCASVKVRVVNKNGERKNSAVVTDILDSSGSVVATAKGTMGIEADSCGELRYVAGPLQNVRLWEPGSPYLYRARTRLQVGSTHVDEQVQRFGLRSIAFSKTDGTFSINGHPLKLRGLNRHETFPFIGRAAADRLQRRDADIIKYDLGCTIVRCSHYPQSPAFLDRCDEIGLLVLEEIPGWLYVSEKPAWQEIALKNVEEMILRDRNHPSIISFGVRINESADFHGLYAKTNRLARSLDPGRPTHGVRVLGRGSHREFLEDVWVYNYAVPPGMPPVMPWITGEHGGHRAAARSWDPEEKLVNQMLAHAAVHDSAEANTRVAGLLGWCAFDYNSPYQYADKKVCYHGVSDIYRFPKHAAWFYRSQADPASTGPMVYIAHRWEKPLSPNEVWVASNCEKVELFVNNRSKGLRFPRRYRSLPHPLFVWDPVPFRPGELKAIGYIGDSVAAVSVRRTPGAPVRLLMVADDTVLAMCGDMTRVAVYAVDSNGQVVPRTNSIVTISVGGAGDFFGESPVALEDGKTAFYVKTKADRAGDITCQAHGQKMAAAEARIAVVRK